MTSDNRTYYQILGVSEDADFEEIRAAFRQKAREYHPDRNQSPDAVERMQEVNEAYEVLRDTDQRAAYDRAHQTFTVPDEQIIHAHAVGSAILGNLAFDVGFQVGTLGRGTRIRRIEDIPTGMWHAAFESGLESLLAGRSVQVTIEAASAAASIAFEDEAMRRVLRHALSERSASREEAFLVDIAVHAVGMLAAATGFRLGKDRIAGRLESEVWSLAYAQIRADAAAALARRGGAITAELSRNPAFATQILEEASLGATESIRQRLAVVYTRGVRRSAGTVSAHYVGGSLGGTVGAVAGAGCLLFFVLPPLFFIITLLAGFCALAV